MLRIIVYKSVPSVLKMPYLKMVLASNAALMDVRNAPRRISARTASTIPGLTLLMGSVSAD